MLSANLFAPAIVSALAAAILAACGGGDDVQTRNPNPPQVAGLAASGAALSGAALTVRCASGPEMSSTTDAAGGFLLTLSLQTLPCMVEVANGADTLHGIATDAGRINVTPLTELIISRAARKSAASAFSGVTPDSLAAIVAGLDGARTALTPELSRLAGWTPAGNPLTQAFSVGDEEDAALVTLAASLSTAGASLDTLRSAAAAGTSLIAALPAEEVRAQDGKAYAVNSSDASATTFAAMAAAPTDVVDMKTTSRFAGVLKGAAYRVEVPANWNGELVMYAHGYAGESLTLNANDSAIRRYLIQSGYAWAASSYSRNSYDVRAGVEDTNALALAFADITKKAAPSRTYIIGHSMGGHIAAAAVEQETYATANNKVRYAGSVPMCGVVGDAELFNTFTAMGMASLTLSGVNNALPSSLTARQRYQMLLPASLNANSVLATVDSILFNGFPNSGYSPKGTAGAQYWSVVENLTGGSRPLFDIGMSFGGSYAGGPHASFGLDGSLQGILNKYNNDNSRVNYVISGDSAATAALNAAAPRVTPDAGFNRMRRDGLRWVPQVNGKPYAPVVTLHTLGDIFVPFNMEQIYRQRLNATGYGAKVVQRAIRGATHCDFTNAEMIAAFDDMVKWVKQGTKPAGDEVLNPNVVGAATYGCTFTRNVYDQDDSSNTRALRELVIRPRTQPPFEGCVAW